MLWKSYKPSNLSMGFDLFDLILTFIACELPGTCPELRRSPCIREMFFLGHVLASWARPPGVRDFFCCLLFGFSLYILGCVILYMWAILVARSVRVIFWVAYAMSSTPYTYAQYHSSIVASACFINRAKLLRCWEKQYNCLGLVIILYI